MTDAYVKPTTLRSIPPAAWWILVLMTSDYVLGMIDRNAVSVLKTTLKTVFSVNDSAYSLLVTAFMIPYSICYILCGRIVDRYGSRGPFTVFVGLWSVATVATGLSTTFPEIVFWRFVLGACEAGLLPVTIYALVTWFPRDRLATVYAIKTPVQSLGAILSPPVVAVLAISYGWRAAFFAPGALGLLFAVLWWFSDRNPPNYGIAEAPVPKQRVRLIEVLRNPIIWGILLARLASDPVWFFFQYWQAGYMQERLGASLADVGHLLWIPPAATAVLTFVTAGVSDGLIRRGRSVPRARLRVMQATVVLSPLIATLPFIGGFPWFLFVVTTSYLLGFTWMYLSNVLVAGLFPKHSVGSAIGVINCVGTLGAAAFNAIAGPVIDAHGYTMLFILLAFCHPAAALIVQYFYRDLLSGRSDGAAEAPAAEEPVA